MPQGKGTYGSQVGRPSKKGKKKYEGGGSVSINADPFSTRNPEGVLVQQAMEAMEDASMANNEQEGLPASNAMPTVNAMERSQIFPDETEYNEGGKV